LYGLIAMANETGLRLKIRLKRKLANTMNGVDLSHVNEGECVELVPAEARLLILEGWAELVDAAPVESPVDTPAATKAAEPCQPAPILEPEPEPY
jgi:hypothetical protein